MALPVLDGNQTATTLSSVVTGGEHIVAHSVVSLGANAIANITSAVSGVSISGTVTANLTYENLYALGVIDNADKLNCNVNAIRGIDPAGWLNSNGGDVPISGTVTANVSTKSWFSSAAQNYLDTQFIAVGGWDNSNSQIAPIPLTDGAERVIVQVDNPISGTVTVGNVEGWGIPLHDYRSFSYSGGNLSTIAYKTGGASGTTVGILTLAYDGSGNLTSMTKS